MISLSTKLRSFVIFVSRRGDFSHIVAGIRENSDLKIIGNSVIKNDALSSILEDARNHGVEVVLEKEEKPLAIETPEIKIETPKAPQKSFAVVSEFYPFSLDLILSTQQTRAPNF